MADLLTWAADPARRRPLLRLLVAAQVLYVLGVAGAGYATAAYGENIVLATAPVDPGDLRQNDFVRLRYTISEASLDLWRGAAAPRRRQGVFVLLALGPDSLHSAVGVYPSAPTAGAGQVVLRGWVTEVYCRSLGLRYNLERYYVSDGSSLRQGNPSRLRRLRVRVSIAPWGQARIAGVDEVGAGKK